LILVGSTDIYTMRVYTNSIPTNSIRKQLPILRCDHRVYSVHKVALYVVVTSHIAARQFINRKNRAGMNGGSYLEDALATVTEDVDTFILYRYPKLSIFCSLLLCKYVYM
jgi:hypothetical protein